ncbi:MAG TPA: tRNA (adenosine(37)-N6)-threonylcarbamoyltransferase complex ATPase subunit type 1 TsaE [Ruminiclostridium sp.]
MLNIETHSFEETVEFGKRLGSVLKPGDIICLTGDLGTGKTALTNGIAKSLGINSYITSPTFTLVNEYEGRIPLYHFDVYRISDPDEMFEIGFEEYINGEGITIIEWGEQIDEILPTEIIRVNINKNFKKDLDVREISIDFIGEKYSGYNV